jgi:hypothetical protein
MAEIVKSKKAAEIVKELHLWHRPAREAWAHWGIPSAEEKSLTRSYKAVELGAEIQGVRGSVGTTAKRRLNIAGLSLFLIGHEGPSRVHLSVGAGRWNYCFQFRKQVSSIFQSVWQDISNWHPSQYLADQTAGELLQAIFLSPLMTWDLRAHVDPLVTSSDACGSGAGITATAGLTRHGVECALHLPAALPAPPSDGFILISLFAGIEGARRALDLLGVRPLRHISVEVDRQAIRTVTAVYPDAILLDDIKEVDRAALDRHLSGVEARFILVVGGSPCQDVSGLNAQRVGLEGARSSLFFELVRVVKLLQDDRWTVFSMTENVASMSNEDRDTFSKWLGIIPHRACSSGFTPVRRPRFYWLNWCVGSRPVPPGRLCRAEP